MKGKEQVSRALSLLEEIIAIPAPSGKEEARSSFLMEKIASILKDEGLEDKVKTARVKNNIILFCPAQGKKTVLLCAHIDTVKPADKYKLDPYSPVWKGNRLYGLGTNDDGGSVVCLLEAFVCQAKKNNACQLILALVCEEENGGKDGMPAVLEYIENQKDIPMPDYALIGEPTGMKAAVGEKGLLVLDGLSTGIRSHAAHPNPDNAIYNALKDIETLKKFSFRRKSEITGPTHLAVTQINAGSAHNIVPESCSFVVDIRFNDKYTPEEIFKMLSAKTASTLKPRNLSHKCRVTPAGLLLEALQNIGIETFISPTSSDWARVDIPAVKIGPGDSSRSHKADEYITKSEIADGIEGFTKLISKIL